VLSLPFGSLFKIANTAGFVLGVQDAGIQGFGSNRLHTVFPECISDLYLGKIYRVQLLKRLLCSSGAGVCKQGRYRRFDYFHVECKLFCL
jgi:hypothetical protein